MSYSSTILADSPLGYWKLDETTGATQFADSSGNSRPATISGTPSYITNRYVDTSSVQFSGTQYGNVTSGAWLSSSNTYSVEVWFATTATGSRAMVMYDNSAQSPGNATRYFMFYISNGAVIFLPFNTAGSIVSVTSPSSSYNDAAWHHAVGTWDGTTVKLYMDGSLVASAALSGTAPTGGSWPITIGTGCNGAVGNYLQYSGYLDEVALYGTTLTSTQVATHYAAATPVSPPSLTQVEASFIETLVTGTPKAQVEANFVESLVSGSRNAQVEAAFIEALVQVQPAQVEAVYAETVLTGTPPIQVEASYLESVLITTPPARIEAAYLEVVLLPLAVPPFTGWGAPI